MKLNWRIGSMSKFEPTASDYIYKAILEELLQEEDVSFVHNDEHSAITLENAAELYYNVEDYFEGDYPSDTLWEILYNFRDSGEECNLPPTEGSRYYEVDFVIKKIDDKWIGWHYWYGGGKHGEPEAIDWVGDAVFVNLKSEEEILTVVRTFERER